MGWNRREWIRGAGLSAASVIGHSHSLRAEVTAAQQKTQEQNNGLLYAGAFGVRADGITNDTAALQAAIDAAHHRGGGTVYLQAGRYLSGTLRLRDHVSLWLDNGATLLMSTNDEDFPSPDAPSSAAAEPASNETSRALLLGDDVHNIAIYGQGSIEGNRNRRGGPKPIFLRDSSEIVLHGITLRNSPNYTVSLFRCCRASIENLTILNSHADGIDLDCCREMHIEGCLVESVDDAICLKSSVPSSSGGVTRHITVSNCTLRTASIHFKCGTESCGDFHSIAVSNCTFDGSMGMRHQNPGIALYTVDGGNLEDVVLSNIVMRDVATPIAILLGNRDAWKLGRGPGLLRGIHIRNVIANGARFPSVLSGLPGKPIRDVHFSGITVRMTQDAPEKAPSENHPAAVPEKPLQYPEPNMFGALPAFGLYLRHLADVEFRSVCFVSKLPSAIPAIAGNDLEHLRFEMLASEGSNSAWFHNLRESFLEAVALGKSERPLLRLSGNASNSVFCRISGSMDTKTQFILDSGLTPGAVHLL